MLCECAYKQYINKYNFNKNNSTKTAFTILKTVYQFRFFKKKAKIDFHSTFGKGFEVKNRILYAGKNGVGNFCFQMEL